MAKDTLRFKLWKTSAAQPYHWTLNVIQNGQVLCTSENYVRKADALNSLNLVYAHAGDTTFEDHTGEN